MQDRAAPTSDTDNFWQPEFAYDRRADGSILMRQVDELETHSKILADYLDHWADVAPDRTWMARRGADGNWLRVSYEQARRDARAIGAGLLAMGLGPDRPLLILSENSLEHALLGLAAAYVGVPFAPVSPAYALVSQDFGKICDIAETLQPGAIFADDGQAFAPALSAISKAGRVVISCRNAAAGDVLFDELRSGNPDTAIAARAGLTPDVVLKYLFTSGSTGTPKAVINTNAMICTSQAMIRDCYRFLTYEPPVVLDWAPWNHTAAGNKVCYLALTNGGTYFIDDGRPVPGKFDETLRNLREISCTWYFNVPVGYDMLVDALETDAVLAQTFFADLGMLFYAGAGMAQHTWDRLSAIGRDVTGHDVVLATGLGATETAPFALACTEIQTQAGNVGVPARGLTLKLVPQAGKLEARLKGATITPGYLGDPVKTAEAFDKEGFYCLGDALRPADPDDLSKGFFFDGRLAENFKLTTGTWVAVGAVRAALVDAFGGLIRDAVIVGEDRAELGALLWLSDATERLDPQTRAAKLQAALTSAAQAATGSASRVRRAIVMDDPPQFARGEATEKGSLNQRALRANRAPLIAALYDGASGVITA
ncbi:feruloyl-CoA synthase [Yoonia sp.]|uniref:feruloyl-CoA synthase n=1 Tax=Yoonia sp. TaxID=2212373 RepID=UPI003F6AC73A